MDTQLVAPDSTLGLIPLEAVPSYLPTRRGRKHHKSTIFRWAARGLHGVRLHTISVGGTRVTTREWLMAFFQEVAAREDQPQAPSPDPQQAARRQRTQDILAKYPKLGRRKS